MGQWVSVRHHETIFCPPFRPGRWRCQRRSFWPRWEHDPHQLLRPEDCPQERARYQRKGLCHHLQGKEVQGGLVVQIWLDHPSWGHRLWHGCSGCRRTSHSRWCLHLEKILNLCKLPRDVLSKDLTTTDSVGEASQSGLVDNKGMFLIWTTSLTWGVMTLITTLSQSDVPVTKRK